MGLVNPYEWIERLGRAWETADKELTLSLFTEDAVYRSQIFREPSVGHEGIGGYWARRQSQRDVRVRFGRPIRRGQLRCGRVVGDHGR